MVGWVIRVECVGDRFAGAAILFADCANGFDGERNGFLVGLRCTGVVFIFSSGGVTFFRYFFFLLFVDFGFTCCFSCAACFFACFACNSFCCFFCFWSKTRRILLGLTACRSACRRHPPSVHLDAGQCCAVHVCCLDDDATTQ